ncbi:MAG: hypothetical protein N2112_09710 [Gemmataceae bacterium]|jgi:hypothetical protein|nr:hypothetical protein [Gemmataceae bacterium]
MSFWAYFRRFWVLQSLLLWQGGFLFYAAIVVPIGTDIHGSFQQGLVTEQVTWYLNLIGLVCLGFLLWEMVTSQGSPLRRSRWAIWYTWLVTLLILIGLHEFLERMIPSLNLEGNFEVYQQFLFYHGVYLWISTLQWVLGMGYLLMILKAWCGNSRPFGNV